MTNSTPNNEKQGDALEWFGQMVIDWYDGQISIGKDSDYIETIRKALTMQEIDIDAMRKDILIKDMDCMSLVEGYDYLSKNTDTLSHNKTLDDIKTKYGKIYGEKI